MRHLFCVVFGDLGEGEGGVPTPATRENASVPLKCCV